MTITATDAAGNVSEEAQVTIDAVAPVPEVTTYTGELLAGTAEPGAAVSVDLDGDGVPDVTTIADEDGSWSVDLTPPLADGTEVTVTATDVAGNVSEEVQVTIDATPPMLSIHGPIAGDGMVNRSKRRPAWSSPVAPTSRTANGGWN